MAHQVIDVVTPYIATPGAVNPALLAAVDRNVGAAVDTAIVAQDIPTLVAGAAAAGLANDPTLRDDLVARVGQLTATTLGVVTGAQERTGRGEGAALYGGLVGENGRATELVVDEYGVVPDDVVLDRWGQRIIPTLPYLRGAARAGLVGENGRATELVVDEYGDVPGDVLARWRERMGATLAAPLPQAGSGRGLLADGPSGVRRLVSDGTRLACWGDSLTAGYPPGDFGTAPSPQSWPGVLAAGWSGTVYNGGVTGQSADEIALRQGGLVLEVTVTGAQIPASGSVQVTTGQAIGWRLDRGWSCPGTLTADDGTVVGGTLSRTGSTLTFTRSSAGAAAPVAAATPFISEPGRQWADAVQVIFAGRNDIGYSVAGLPIVDRVVAATVAMVERLTPAHPRVLVVGTTTATTETAGTTGHTQVTEINQALAALYPHAWFDLRAYLAHQAIYDLGITPTATDLARMDGDTLPPSIMAAGGTDTVHYSAATAAAVATRLRTVLDEKAWLTA